MKIVFFSSYFYPYISGLTTYPFKILKYLAKSNQITVLTYKYSSELKNEEYVSNIKIVRMPYVFKISKGFISPQSWLIFLKEAKKNDVIFLNIPNAEGLSLAIFAKLMKKKIISVLHCQVNLGNSFISKIINTVLDISVFFRLLLTDKIITQTKDYFMSLNYSNLFLKKTSFTLPPIDYVKPDIRKIEMFSKIKKNDYVVGYVGRISREKGLEYLIEAISGLKSRYSNIKVFLAGPFGKNVAGEEEYFNIIKSRLNKAKINYKFFGYLSDSELSAFYRILDVLVLPSVNKTEAFGIVQAEAMLQGTPVIATDLPGVKIPILLTKMGIIVPPKNPQLLMPAIEEIINHRKQYANSKLIKNAYLIFDIKNVYKFYDQLIYR